MYRVAAIGIVGIIVWYLWARKRTHESDFSVPRTPTEQERLDELIRRGDILADYIESNKYPSEPIAKRLVRNWHVLRTGQRIGITPDNTDTPGFVINKTTSMQLCVTKKPGAVGDLDDANTSAFVLIHEMAHLGALEYEHGAEFLTIFKDLLRASIKLGIWKYTDYTKKPRMYCDYYVNATPKL